ncbi:MAG: aspartyl protease family protein [Alphaproteobacteria bacterium]|nr:aspartyl protease family protein [Alphaproteobacteria bacterium]
MTVAVTLLFMGATSAMAKECKLTQLAEMDMRENVNGWLLIDIGVEGKAASVVIDTGATLGMISRGFADHAGLELKPVATRTGYAGSFQDWAGNYIKHLVDVEHLQIAGSDIPGTWSFMATTDFSDAPWDDGEPVGVIGVDILRHFDAEIDIKAGKFRLFKRHFCEQNPLYWANEWLELPFRWRSIGNNLKGGMLANVVLDGKKIEATLDTGASITVLDWKLAKELYGLTPDSPGVQPLGQLMSLRDEGRHDLHGYRFKTLEFGGVTLNNVVMGLADMGKSEMLLGMPQLKHFRMYIAFERHTIYFTPK